MVILVLLAYRTSESVNPVENIGGSEGAIFQL